MPHPFFVLGVKSCDSPAQAELQAHCSDGSCNIVFSPGVLFHRDNDVTLGTVTGNHHSSDLLALNQSFIERMSSGQ